MRALEIALLLVQTVAVLVTIWYARRAITQGKEAVEQGKETALILESEGFSRQLSDLIDVVSRLDGALRRKDAITVRTLQIQLRARLVPLAGPQEMPRAFELADETVNSGDDFANALELVEPVVGEIREAAASRHRIVRLTSLEHERAISPASATTDEP